MGIPVTYKHFFAMAQMKAQDDDNARYADFDGAVQVKDRNNTWRSVNRCDTCEQDFSDDDLVFYDEINAIVICRGCHG